MAITKISEWSTTPGSNTEIDGISLAEGVMVPSSVNNAMREHMSQIAEMYAGTSGDKWPVAAGGTGSTSAAGARANLGVIGAGDNNTFTGTNTFTGSTRFAAIQAASATLDTPLAVAQGGTGSQSAVGARTNLGIYKKGASVGSAATTDIWAGADGDFVHVSTGGVSTITSFGTAPAAGDERTVIFDGVCTLTHNATSLKLPGGANITTAANDRCVVRADTTANMIVTDYTKADGTAVVTSSSGFTVTAEAATTSGTTAQITGIPATAKVVFISIRDVSTNGTTAYLIRVGPSGGVVSTGYKGTGVGITAAPVTSTHGFSTSFIIVNSPSAATSRYGGLLTLTLEDATNNRWLASGVFGDATTGLDFWSLSGYVSFSGALERVQITTSGGDTFDNGAFAVTYL